MTEASRYLLRLAEQVAAAYASLPMSRAVMVTGSAALGQSDFYSDLDMTVYYDVLPTEEELRAARTRNGAADRRWLLGERAGGAFAEAYLVRGVEVQIGHTTIVAWERDMATVLEDYDTETPLQKALSGTLDCVPLYGGDAIDRWKAQAAAYPDGLARAMVEKHLTVFPLWHLEDRLAARDAKLWQYQSLLEAAQNILGVLAGLNHLYYSTFQFKRMRDFIGKMRFASDGLADRLEGLFVSSAEAAALQVEELFAETIALVEQEMPEIDTSAARRRLGTRQQPWTPVPEETH